MKVSCRQKHVDERNPEERRDYREQRWRRWRGVMTWVFDARKEERKMKGKMIEIMKEKVRER